MELNIPTIAQRKAARRNQNQNVETSTSNLIEKTPEAGPPPSVLEKKVSIEPELPNQNLVSKKNLDKEALVALARSMGLELTTPKKIWIKHSYSITPENKQKFSNYCDVLGIKMQDALDESLIDWFNKKEAEYKAVSQVRKSD